MKQQGLIRLSYRDRIILNFGYLLLALFVLAIVVPMVYIVVASFIDPVTLQNKGITFDFAKWTLTRHINECFPTRQFGRALRMR